MRTLRIPIVIAALCAGAFASDAAAQGGWRQWDVYLRDGRLIEANPLGAPDDRHVAISVGGMEGDDATILRTRIDYVAAQTGKLPGSLASAPLPPPPKAVARRDLVVRLDGRRTEGRVTLKRIRFSEGVVVQNGVEINLEEVAYIKFAPSRQRSRPPARDATPHPRHRANDFSTISWGYATRRP
jgi:hypothetical protein